MTSSWRTWLRLELLDKAFFLFVKTSAPGFSGVIWSAPYPFRSNGMGDRPVLPESRLLAIEIKKNPAITNIKPLFMVLNPPQYDGHSLYITLPPIYGCIPFNTRIFWAKDFIFTAPTSNV
ncbi:MAG: hypothetical protein NTX42_07545 [Methanothrix sp.]|nr:hypothetical protein [Methanothrix sp.]